MTWKCPNCGFDANEDENLECTGGCGYVRLAECVTLTGEATGQSVRMKLDTSVGKYLLRKAVGDDYVYAAEPQFRVYKDSALAAWAIRHDLHADNPTYLNGEPLDAEPKPLTDGAIISIGPEKAKVTVGLSG